MVNYNLRDLLNENGYTGFTDYFQNNNFDPLSKSLTLSPHQGNKSGLEIIATVGDYNGKVRQIGGRAGEGSWQSLNPCDLLVIHEINYVPRKEAYSIKVSYIPYEREGEPIENAQIWVSSSRVNDFLRNIVKGNARKLIEDLINGNISDTRTEPSPPQMVQLELGLEIPYSSRYGLEDYLTKDGKRRRKRR